MRNNIIIICGPTASGKSKFAIEVAKAYNGAIINADSMQLYKGFEVLTSSPTDDDKNLISHHLYNCLALNDAFSVAKYQERALNVIESVQDAGYLPIIVGGTGLYINALINGLNAIPEIDHQVRLDAESLLDQIGNEEFYNNLISIDPLISDNINMADRQRMIRAYEVIKQTGKSIRYFQSINIESPLSGYKVSTMLLSPQRDFLYKTCNERFLQIIKSGAMEEVDSLYRLSNTIRANPLGFKELSSFYLGKISLEEAIILAQNKTRQYAKRQVTWFKNQVREKSVITFSSTKDYNAILGNINDIISL